MTCIVDLLGESLVYKDGTTSPVSKMWSGDKGGDTSSEIGSDNSGRRVLGLYFSAHWCPPCRMFNPDLVQFYTNFKATDRGDQLEIVFVSSDQDKEGFQEYLSEMPWPALPFDDRDRKV